MSVSPNQRGTPSPPPEYPPPGVSNAPVEADDVHQPPKEKTKSLRDELPLVHVPTKQGDNYGQRGVTTRPCDEKETSDYEDGPNSSSLPLLPVLEKGKDAILSKKGTIDSSHQEENELPQWQRGNKKVVRDPNAPTYPRTAYTLYSTSFAARIVVEEAHPDLTSDGVTKAIAANWNAMSDESKAAWNHMAADDEERYQREMDAYKGSELESQWLASVEENQLKMERKAAEEAAKSCSGGLYTVRESTEAGKHSSCSKTGVEVERYQISHSLWIVDDEHGGEV
ncbi:hypothetical protein ACHAWC_011935 [Mediolabrus comicus]